MGKDPFEILGIAQDATRREAEAAYRRLAELFHPDRLQGLRDEVRAEGERRLQDATEAMRELRARFARPLRAPGHDVRDREPEPPASPVRAADIPGGAPPSPLAPSDAATEEEAHVYEVLLRSTDGPPLQVRWHGRHAAATLAALRHAHRVHGAIRQLEWGTYEVVLDGAATRRLLRSVLGDAELVDPVEIQSRADGGAAGPADLDAVVDLLIDDGRYEVVADVY